MNLTWVDKAIIELFGRWKWEYAYKHYTSYSLVNSCWDMLKEYKEDCINCSISKIHIYEGGNLDMILPIDKLPQVKLEQMKNYPNAKRRPKFKVDFNGKLVDAEVWQEDPVNYHYYIVDEKNNCIRLGLSSKSGTLSFDTIYDEYKRMKNGNL